MFHHRIKRYVRKDGTVSYLGAMFEVPYELSGKTVLLVVDPHAGVVVGVEDEAGEMLGLAPGSMRMPTCTGCGENLLGTARAGTAQRPHPDRNGAGAVPRQAGGLKMYLQHFGLRHTPLGKDGKDLWDDGALVQLAE